ncbi:hypothetical protein [Actinomadura bangladeshensis]|uniref:PH domain-containing protein n=1 Tax=Actinomadura bangladeshensis TaxID=453573 RepID=A0A4R4NVZ3_9ACTN|nr:hypothetical protein [Actinomadura bangladeshensis]TDC12283.1 hypothetical protein E1284_24340 [Actinomadura bangladeshensis]
MSVRESDLVLRPDVRAGLIVVAVLVVAGASIVAAILIGDAPTAFAPFVAVLFTALAVLGIASLLRARIVLTPQEIVVRGVFSQQHRPRAQAAEIVRATITAPRGASGESLFILDAQRNLLIRVSGAAFKREDLDLLVAELGVPCSGYDHPVAPKRFAEMYPGLITKAEQYPYRLAFTAIAVICAIAALTAAVMAATS